MGKTIKALKRNRKKYQEGGEVLSAEELMQQGVNEINQMIVDDFTDDPKYGNNAIYAQKALDEQNAISQPVATEPALLEKTQAAPVFPAEYEEAPAYSVERESRFDEPLEEIQMEATSAPEAETESILAPTYRYDISEEDLAKINLGTSEHPLFKDYVPGTDLTDEQKMYDYDNDGRITSDDVITFLRTPDSEKQKVEESFAQAAEDTLELPAYDPSVSVEAYTNRYQIDVTPELIKKRVDYVASAGGGGTPYVKQTLSKKFPDVYYQVFPEERPFDGSENIEQFIDRTVFTNVTADMILTRNQWLQENNEDERYSFYFLQDAERKYPDAFYEAYPDKKPVEIPEYPATGGVDLFRYLNDNPEAVVTAEMVLNRTNFLDRNPDKRSRDNFKEIIKEQYPDVYSEAFPMFDPSSENVEEYIERTGASVTPELLQEAISWVEKESPMGASSFLDSLEKKYPDAVYEIYPDRIPVEEPEVIPETVDLLRYLDENPDVVLTADMVLNRATFLDKNPDKRARDGFKQKIKNQYPDVYYEAFPDEESLLGSGPGASPPAVEGPAEPPLGSRQYTKDDPMPKITPDLDVNDPEQVELFLQDLKTWEIVQGVRTAYTPIKYSEGDPEPNSNDYENIEDFQKDFRSWEAANGLGPQYFHFKKGDAQPKPEDYTDATDFRNAKYYYQKAGNTFVNKTPEELRLEKIPNPNNIDIQSQVDSLSFAPVTNTLKMPENLTEADFNPDTSKGTFLFDENSPAPLPIEYQNAQDYQKAVNAFNSLRVRNMDASIRTDYSDRLKNINSVNQLTASFEWLYVKDGFFANMAPQFTSFKKNFKKGDPKPELQNYYLGSAETFLTALTNWEEAQKGFTRPVEAPVGEAVPERVSEERLEEIENSKLTIEQQIKNGTYVFEPNVNLDDIVRVTDDGYIDVSQEFLLGDEQKEMLLQENYNAALFDNILPGDIRPGDPIPLPSQTVNRDAYIAAATKWNLVEEARRIYGDDVYFAKNMDEVRKNEYGGYILDETLGTTANPFPPVAKFSNIPSWANNVRLPDRAPLLGAIDSVVLFKEEHAAWQENEVERYELSQAIAAEREKAAQERAEEEEKAAEEEAERQRLEELRIAQEAEEQRQREAEAEAQRIAEQEAAEAAAEEERLAEIKRQEEADAAAKALRLEQEAEEARLAEEAAQRLLNEQAAAEAAAAAQKAEEEAEAQRLAEQQAAEEAAEAERLAEIKRQEEADAAAKALRLEQEAEEARLAEEAAQAEEARKQAEQAALEAQLAEEQAAQEAAEAAEEEGSLLQDDEAQNEADVENQSILNQAPTTFNEGDDFPLYANYEDDYSPQEWSEEILVNWFDAGNNFDFNISFTGGMNFGASAPYVAKYHPQWNTPVPTVTAESGRDFSFIDGITPAPLEAGATGNDKYISFADNLRQELTEAYNQKDDIFNSNNPSAPIPPQDPGPAIPDPAYQGPQEYVVQGDFNASRFESQKRGAEIKLYGQLTAIYDLAQAEYERKSDIAQEPEGPSLEDFVMPTFTQDSPEPNYLNYPVEKRVDVYNAYVEATTQQQEEEETEQPPDAELGSLSFAKNSAPPKVNDYRGVSNDKLEADRMAWGDAQVTLGMDRPVYEESGLNQADYVVLIQAWYRAGNEDAPLDNFAPSGEGDSDSLLDSVETPEQPEIGDGEDTETVPDETEEVDTELEIIEFVESIPLKENRDYSELGFSEPDKAIYNIITIGSGARSNQNKAKLARYNADVASYNTVVEKYDKVLDEYENFDGSEAPTPPKRVYAAVLPENPSETEIRKFKEDEALFKIYKKEQELFDNAQSLYLATIGAGDNMAENATVISKNSSGAPTNIDMSSPNAPSVTVASPTEARTDAGSGTITSDSQVQALDQAGTGTTKTVGAGNLGTTAQQAAPTSVAGPDTDVTGSSFTAKTGEATTATAASFDGTVTAATAPSITKPTITAAGRDQTTVDTAQATAATGVLSENSYAIAATAFTSAAKTPEGIALQEASNSAKEAMESDEAYKSAMAAYTAASKEAKPALLESVQAVESFKNYASAEAERIAFLENEAAAKIASVEGPAVSDSYSATSLNTDDIAQLISIAEDRGVDIEDLPEFDATKQRTAQSATAAAGTATQLAGQASSATAAQAGVGTASSVSALTTDIEDVPSYSKAASRTAQTADAAAGEATTISEADVAVDLGTREAITGTAPQGSAAEIGGVPTFQASQMQAVTSEDRTVSASQMLEVVANLPEATAAAIAQDPAVVAAQLDTDPDPTVSAKIAALPTEALVSSQMELLLAGIETDNIPAWARPTVAALDGVMARRGLSASTVGRDAMFNAIIQSALPIAQGNATALQNRANLNLTNEQNAEIAAANNIMQIRLGNLANRQLAASETARMAQEIAVKQSTFDQQAAVISSEQQQQTAMQNTQNAQAKATADAQMAQQAALAQFSENSRRDYENLKALNDASVTNLNAEQSARLKTYDAQITTLVRQAELDQDIEKANLNASLSVELQNLSQQNDAAKDTMTAENQERLVNLQTLVDLRKTNATFAQQMDMANLSNEQQIELAMLQEKAATDSANFTADNQFRLAELNNKVQRSIRQAELDQRIAEINLDAELKLELTQLTELNATNRANMSEDNRIRLANLNALIDFKKTNATLTQQMEMANLSNEQQITIANLTEKAAADAANFTEANRFELQKLTTAAQLLSSNEQLRLNADMARLSTEERVALANLTYMNQFDSAKMTAENTAELQRYEKEIAVAQSNAQLAQQMGMQQLSNQQQAAMFNAQINANLDMKQFDFEQQASLANSQFMQTMTLKEFDAEQQAAIQNATLLANLNVAEADQATRVSITNAQNFLKMDMSNLANQQQIAVVNAQIAQQTLLSNIAAENAAAQFGAANQQQADQFMASLGVQIEQYNVSAMSARNQFNAQESNRQAAIAAGNYIQAASITAQMDADMQKFNEQQDLARDQWNAANAQAVEQSNIQWRRQANTANSAAQNAANQQNAQIAFNLTSQEQTQLWQQLRDEAAYIRQAYENEEQRNAQLYATALSNEVAVKDGSYKDKLLSILNFED